jgi:hypothetical protein
MKSVGSSYRFALTWLATACAAPAPPVGITPHAELVKDAEEQSAARPAAAARPRATSLVVFGVEKDGLLPLACFDGGLRRIQGGNDCLPLVPEGGQVKTDREQVYELGRHQEVACPRGATHRPGVGLVNYLAAELKPGTQFAVWPSTAATELVASRADDKPTAAELGEFDSLLRQVLSQESTDNLPGAQQAFQVYSGDQVDLDGDGKMDRVFSGVVDSLEGLRFTGLIGFLTTRQGQPSILHRDSGHTYYLRGSINLDGSGGKELLVTRALVQHATGSALQVEHAVAVLEGNEYRVYGLPCPLVAENE